MEPDLVVTVALLDTPGFWRGLITAIIGVSFWVAGLAILYVIYERYLKGIDAPEGFEDGER